MREEKLDDDGGEVTGFVSVGVRARGGRMDSFGSIALAMMRYGGSGLNGEN